MQKYTTNTCIPQIITKQFCDFSLSCIKMGRRIINLVNKRSQKNNFTAMIIKKYLK